MSAPGLHLSMAGEGDRPLLMLHGLGADHGQPLALAGHALRSRFRLLAPDLRAHGRTRLDEGPGLLTISRLAADVEDAIRALAPLPGMIVAGISMGAAVVVELLARRAVAIEGFVLIRPAWLWEPDPPNLAPFPQIAKLLRSGGPEEGKEAFRWSRQYAEVAEVSPAAASALLGQFDAPRAKERAHRLTAFPASAPSRPARAAEAAGAVRAGLVIAAPDDPVHPVETAERVARTLDVPLEIVAPRYDEPAQHARQVAQAISAALRNA